MWTACQAEALSLPYTVFSIMGQPLKEEGLRPGPRFKARFKEGMSYQARVLLSDVDNTILPHESLDLPTPRVTQAFRDGGEKVRTGLATARQHQKFDYLAGHLRLTGKSILSNGAQIFDGKTGLMVVERWLNVGTTMNIARALQANGVGHHIQDNGVDHWWIPQRKVARRAKETSEGLGLYRCQQNVFAPQKGVKDVPAYTPQKPFIIVANNVDAVTAIGIQDMVKGQKDEQITAFIAHEHKGEAGKTTFDVFITDKQANKLTALHEVEQIEKIPLDEFIAIGDGHNDKVLLENVGVGVAVDNAVEPVRQVAVYIAPSVEQDGAAIAIEKLVLKKTP
jgi:HAD superfamily hydrolase (TIGR01484 family)